MINTTNNPLNGNELVRIDKLENSIQLLWVKYMTINVPVKHRYAELHFIIIIIFKSYQLSQ